MKRPLSEILLLAVVLWSVVSRIAIADERPSGIPSDAKYVKVDRVTDGDTIVLTDSTRVRLHGIDTPERDQPYGPAGLRPWRIWSRQAFTSSKSIPIATAEQ